MFRAHVLEICRGMKLTYCKTKILCIKLVNYRYKYTEMHGQQNIKILLHLQLVFTTSTAVSRHVYFARVGVNFPNFYAPNRVVYGSLLKIAVEYI